VSKSPFSVFTPTALDSKAGTRYENRIKKSCSCSIKWCSYSYSKDRIRARAPSSTEHDYEHEKPKNMASGMPNTATSKGPSRSKNEQIPTATCACGSLIISFPESQATEEMGCGAPYGDSAFRFLANSLQFWGRAVRNSRPNFSVGSSNT
jgi:hypothetical protein